MAKWLSKLLAKQHFSMQALLLGEHLDLKALGQKKRGGSPHFIETGQGVAVVFRYGAVVLFGLDEAQTLAFVQQCRGYLTHPYDQAVEETLEVQISPSHPEGMRHNTLIINTLTPERLEIAADVMGKSVMLEKHEELIAQRFEKVKPIAASMIDGGPHHRDKELLKYIGLNLITEHELAGRVEVTEKPPILWDNADLEPLYEALLEDLEINERQAILDRKLDVISRTAQTTLELTQHHRGLRVEWYIVVLILIEIVLQLYSLSAGAPIH